MCSCCAVLVCQPCWPCTHPWALVTLQNLCIRFNPDCVPCRIGEQPLVRVTLHPPLEGSLQPGATLAGTLDFSQPAAAAQRTAAGGGSSSAAPHAPRCMQV